jgi:hypothetical protein
MRNKLLLFSALCIGMITNAQNIVSGEYFFDTYKNLGEGTAFSIVPDNIINKNLSIPTTNLSSGMHNLFVRVKDANDTWSLVENKLFYIMPPLSNQGNLAACEWFIDTDPGLGNGTITNFSTPATTIAMPLSINTTNLNSGLHRLYVRVKDDSNLWSVVECKLFYIMPAATSQPNLTAGEWFVDSDPGVGNGTVINFVSGAVINKTFDISNASFSVGIHKLFVRVKNSDGVWSLYDAKDFTVTPSSPPPPPTASAQSLCKSSTVANLAATGSNLKWYNTATGGSALATTTLLTTKTYYVSQSAGAFESTRTSVPVTIVTLPVTPGTITGAVAQGSLVGTTTTATYSVAAVTGASSYFWTAPTGATIVSGQGTTSVNVNFLNVASGAGTIGNLMVQSVNDTGCKSVAKTLLLTKALPTAPSILTLTDGVTTTGITNISKYTGSTTILKLTTAPVSTATSYEWELPAGVYRTDALGTNSTAPYIFVNFSGVTNSNTYSYYTTAAIPVLTYVLRIGVKAKNGVGVSITSNASLASPQTTSTAKLLTLKATLPAAVSNVIGQSVGICGRTTYHYTITPSASASSYRISAPSGAIVTSVSNPNNTENILLTSDLIFSITFPDIFIVNASTTVANKTITITAVNGVGNSATNKTITLSTTVPTISSISGGTTYSSCDQTFTAATVLGAIEYTWIVPTGASIISGQGTSLVVVNYGSLTGVQTIKVKATNICGVSSTLKSLSLTSGSCPSGLKQEVTNFNRNSTIVLYPNPTRDWLTISNSTNTSIDKVIIIDLLGNIIMENRPTNNQIDVAQFASGTYLIEVYSGQKKYQSKFVKL